MEILDFNEFRQHQLILEEEDPMATPPPASPAVDIPPPPPSPAPAPMPGTDMSLPPDPNEQPVAEEPADFKFVFIQDASQKKWYGVADKDGGVKRFTVHSIPPAELTQWLEAHDESGNADIITAALKGKRPMPSAVYSDFKREVVDGTLGSDKGPIDITFDSDTDFDNPSTTDLNVVFLNSKK